MDFKAGILDKNTIPIPTSAAPFKIFLHIFGFIADIPLPVNGYFYTEYLVTVMAKS